MSNQQRYPLAWPPGWQRTPPSERQAARFKVRASVARDELYQELLRLGAREIVLSSDIPIKKDGTPYAGRGWILGQDPGVAVYFLLKGKPKAFASDRFTRPEHNMRALGKTIEALRGVERWGVSGILDRAFEGFDALPAPEHFEWREVLGFPPDVLPTTDQIIQKYRALSRIHHPDAGGSDAQMARVNRAKDAAIRELGPAS